ncbi:MAG: hypothetical protein ACJAZB_002004 [Psychrosphaera sp.]|jgi:hypothetical protein
MSNIYTRIIKVILICYLLLNGAIWAFSPLIVDKYLTDFLANKNLQLNETSSVRYNPFISQIYITDLQMLVLNKQESNETDPQAKVVNEDVELISIPTATIEFSLFKLFAKRVVIEKFEISGLKTDVSRTLAHINALPAQPDNIKSESAKSEQSNHDWLSSLSFEMPLFSFSNATLLFDLEGQEQVVEFSQMTLTDLLVSQHKQSADIDISLLFNQALIELDASFGLGKGVGELQYDLDIQEVSLGTLNSLLMKSTGNAYRNIDGLVSLNLKQEVAFSKTEISSQIQDINFLLANLVVEQNGQQNVRLNLVDLGIKEGVVEILLPHSVESILNPEHVSTMNVMQDLTLRSNLNFQQNDLLVTLADNDRGAVNELLKLTKLDIPDIDILLEGGESLIQASLLELNNITLVNSRDDVASQKEPQPTQQAELPLLELEKLTVADIQLTKDSLHIANIDFAKIKAAITKLKDGQIVQLNSVLPPANTPTNGTQVPSESNSDKKPEVVEQKVNENKFDIYIGKISLEDSLHFAISDTSVSPSYENIIQVTSFSVEPIDSSMPNDMSKIRMTGDLDQYSKFTLDAEIKPFSSKKYIKADINVTEFDLSTITAYIKEIMAIESGQLNTVTNFIIDDDIIKGNAKLNIARVELAEAVEYDESNTVDTFIPVNVALSMLKDGKGNIELDVPVEGSLDSPDFRLSGFMALLIQRATMSATKKYLMNAFVPYANIIQIGMQAGEFILKVRFQDLILETGEDELPKSADVFLNQFSALMLDKKSTQITVCAVATKTDIDVQNSEKLTSNQLDKLNKLSLKRMKNFKDYMIENHQIDSARLLLCAPKIDTAVDAKPRLTFTN